MKVRTPKITILCGPPGYDSTRIVAQRFAASSSAVVTSSNSAAIAHVRDIVEQSDAALPKYETGAIEIRTLGDLVRVFCEIAQLSIGVGVSPEHQVALAALAAEGLDAASPFHLARSLPGFHEALATTLQDMRRHRVTLETVEVSSKKLEDIRGLEERFEIALQRLNMSTLSHRIAALLDQKPVAPRGLKHVFWVGEAEWPPIWLELAQWIVKAGVSLTVLAEQHPHNPEFFPSLGRLRAAFPDALVEQLQRTSHYPGEAMFSDAPGGDASGIRILYAADEFVETEWAMRHALEAVAEGTSAEKICFFARGIERYGPLLEAAARRFGQRLSMTRHEPVLTNPFARYCLSVLKACATGKVAMLADLMRSGYSDLPIEKRPEAAEAVMACSAATDPWAELAASAMDERNPAPKWLLKLVEWRESAVSRSSTPADWEHGLNRLIGRTPWLDMSVSFGEPLAGRDNSARDTMIRSLNIRRIALPAQEQFTLRDFARHCEETWSMATYALRTAGTMSVASTPWGIGPADTVIVVGVTEGRFPRRRAEDPVLLDADRKLLGGVLPSSYEKAEEDRREFYRILCSAPKLLFSAPEVLGDHHEAPAYFLQDLRTLLPSIEEMHKGLEDRFPEPQECRSISDLIPSVELKGGGLPEAYGPIRERLREAVDNAETQKIQDENLRAEISEIPVPMRLSYLRALRRCPFQYIARAKLGLKSRADRSAWDRLSSVVRRTNMRADTLKELTERLRESLRLELEELKGRIPKEEIELVAIAGPRALDAFAAREFDARAAWGARPVSQNVRLAEAGMRAAMKSGNARVVFDETIDILYQRDDGSLIPLRMAYASERAEHDIRFESGLMISLQPSAQSNVHSAAIDSLQTGWRPLLVSRARGGSLGLKAAPNLSIIIAEERNDLLRNIATEVEELISIAMRGDVRPTPEEHCSRCELGSLCRKSLNAEMLGPIWPEDDEEDPFEA